MNLSKRLQMIINEIPEGKILADIGTDHGYVPIYCVANGLIPSAVAMDVNKGPLEKATVNIKSHQCEDKIQVRLSNGLEQLSPDEVNTILIAGMGGHLICDILEKGSGILESIDTLIVSPHSEYGLVRKKLHQIGFKIVNETFLLDDKYYVIIKAQKGNEQYIDEKDYLYGKILRERKDQALYNYLIGEVIALSELVDLMLERKSERLTIRVEELKSNIEQIREVLDEYAL